MAVLHGMHSITRSCRAAVRYEDQQRGALHSLKSDDVLIYGTRGSDSTSLGLD